MDFKLLLNKISEHYKNELPFAIYSKPDKSILNAYFQKDEKLHHTENLLEDGYVMANFDFNDNACFIPANKSELIKSDFETEKVDLEFVDNPSEASSRDEYIGLINKTISAIENGEMTKVVTSRFKDLSLKSFDIELLVRRILSSYPNAYRYIWYHPKTGIWCGATPEVLMQISGNSFETMALAGTQLYKDGPIHWGEKELHEQQVVTDNILDNLAEVTSSLEVSEVKTQRAGGLVHLKTDIRGIFRSGKTSIAHIANKLHPTPAIGGSPQKLAKKFILENEGYSREFYTGFFGAISDNATSATFMVNLRSMRIQNDIARVFVGGGITLGSIPEDEWEETQNKMQTMLQVLKPML